MPSQEDIEAQKKLLETNRRTLHIYLRQRDQLGSAYTPPGTITGIEETRDKIVRIKHILRSWGVAVVDHPDDSELPLGSSSSSLRPPVTLRAVEPEEKKRKNSTRDTSITIALITSFATIIVALIGLIPSLHQSNPPSPTVAVSNTIAPSAIAIAISSPAPSQVTIPPVSPTSVPNLSSPTAVIDNATPTLSPTEPVKEAIRIDTSVQCNGIFLHYRGNFSRINNVSLRDLASGDIAPPICVLEFYSIDVVNIAGDEQIRMPAYVVVRIIDSSPLDPNERFNFVEAPIGGPGFPDYFTTILSPERKTEFGATLERGTVGTNAPPLTDIIAKYGFFTLAPTERESFLVLVEGFPGYHYKFQIGIYYTYKGHKDIKWINDVFDIYGETLTFNKWKAENDNLNLIGEESTDLSHYRDRLKTSIDASDKAITQDPTFNLPLK